MTVGKFNPPHLGHAHLLTVAARRVDHLYVLLGDRSDQTIAATRRARWLAEAAPTNTTILVTPDELPAANEPWAQRALEVLPEPPTVAFTSEAWGPGWAELMGARHVMVDRHRNSVPISATEIRSDLRRGFEWLVPAARAELARRVVVAGAESTGKTTLAEALAEHYRTVWVPEYGRAYWEARRHCVDQRWTADEFTHIATTHHDIAERVARRAGNGLVVLDTDALVTDVWRRRYLGEGDAQLTDLALRHPAELYLVCSPDFDWVQDGTRESADHQHRMHEHTLEAIAASEADHRVLTGALDRRLVDAIEAIEPVLRFPTLT